MNDLAIFVEAGAGLLAVAGLTWAWMEWRHNVPAHPSLPVCEPRMGPVCIDCGAPVDSSLQVAKRLPDEPVCAYCEAVRLISSGKA